MAQTLTLAEHIARTLDALQRCQKTGNAWAEKHRAFLDVCAHELPHGSGLDSKAVIQLDSTPEAFKVAFGYHHMNDGGYYDGWTEHTVTVRASLIVGLSLAISGRDRNGIKEYLYQTYDYALSCPYTVEYDHGTEEYSLVSARVAA